MGVKDISRPLVLVAILAIHLGAANIGRAQVYRQVPAGEHLREITLQMATQRRWLEMIDASNDAAALCAAWLAPTRSDGRSAMAGWFWHTVDAGKGASVTYPSLRKDVYDYAHAFLDTVRRCNKGDQARMARNRRHMELAIQKMMSVPNMKRVQDQFMVNERTLFGGE